MDIAQSSTEELAALAKFWVVLLPHTALDTRTGLRFDARTARLMHTPEFVDWHDQSSRSQSRALTDISLGKLLEQDIKAYEAELRALLDTGLLSYKPA